MIDEKRFQRLEDKVDDIKDNMVEMNADFKIHIAHVEEHITGDKKIIDELKPVLSKLPDIVEMAEQYRYEKKTKKKLLNLLGVVSVLVGIAVGVVRIFG